MQTAHCGRSPGEGARSAKVQDVHDTPEHSSDLYSAEGRDLLKGMRSALDVCGCFPTGRHYPGIAARLSRVIKDIKGLAKGFAADQQWVEQKLAIIDFETTGLDSSQDRIIEVGVVCFEGGELTQLKNFLVNPRREVSTEVLELTKIDADELRRSPPLEDVLAEFQEILAGHLPVAYNAPFDRGFLLSELKRLRWADRESELAWPPAFDESVHWIDPLVWVRELQKHERSKKLGDVCARLGITLDNAHRAASDAEATGRVLFALAAQLPQTYGELIRLQDQYAGRQEVDMSAAWRRRS